MSDFAINSNQRGPVLVLFYREPMKQFATITRLNLVYDSQRVGCSKLTVAAPFFFFFLFSSFPGITHASASDGLYVTPERERIAENFNLPTVSLRFQFAQLCG